MDNFLLNVVKDVLNKHKELANILFVLPNRRAGIYLKKYLKDSLTKTDILPEIITFDNFSERLAGIPKITPLELLFDFYSIYLSKTPKAKIESFESFSQWATIILNDINEIDTYLVNPKDIFGTLKDINKLQNWSPNTELTKQYLLFFQYLETYYIDLQKMLQTKQKAYQGLLFKKAVESIHLFIENTDYQLVFAGFNHLNTSEEQIIQELLNQNRAEIYFDYPKFLLDKNSYLYKYQTSWSYFKDHKVNWINKKPIDESIINIIGVSKNVGMLKQAGEIIAKSKDYNKTALILANQNLLPIALNSIPQKTLTTNITMGIPLQQMVFSDFVKRVFKLHINKAADSKKGFYHTDVLAITQHPILQKSIDNCKLLSQKLINLNKVYIHFNDIKEITRHHDENNIIKILFEPIQKDTNQQFLSKLIDLVNFLKDITHADQKEVLFKHYQLYQQLKELITKYNYIDSLSNLFHLYKQLLFSENINFIGEPLQGLQIMGFLETQALDFKEVIVTSINEGILPKGKQSKSFIPFDVRKKYQLPTYEDEDLISKYHFYRLLHRAEKIHLLYNLDPDTFGGGEKSRFLTQLLWRYPNIKQKIIHTDVPSEALLQQSVTKTPQVINQIKELFIKGISPSSISSYLYDPIAFYYKKILNIEEISSIEEIVENNTMGTIIHNSLETLYKPFIGKIIKVIPLENSLKKIDEIIALEFGKVYKNGKYEQGKNKLIYEVIKRFIIQFAKREIREIKEGKIIRIIALEKKLSQIVTFPKFDFPIRINGTVDRIDEINGVLRIIDYKSGRVEEGQLKISDFELLRQDYKYSKALQVMLYTYLYTQNISFDFSKELQAGIVSFKNHKKGFMGVNFSKERKKDFTIKQEQIASFMIIFQDLLLEIYNDKIPFLEKQK